MKAESEQAYQFEQGNVPIDEAMKRAEINPTKAIEPIKTETNVNTPKEIIQAKTEPQNVTKQTEATPKEDTTLMSDRTVVAGVDGSVSNKKVQAYQFENPEVKPYFQDYAQYILDNEFVDNAQLNRPTKVMEMIKTETGMTPKAVKDGLERLVHNQGQENVAAAKKNRNSN